MTKQFTGGIALTEKQDVDLGAMKEAGETPFGQLPVLTEGSVRIAQTGAIIRYLAAKAGLDGRGNDADFGMSEMLIEEALEIYGILAKAMYAPEGREQGMNNIFDVSTGAVHKHLGYLERLIAGDYFCSRPLAGDCEYR